MKTSKRFASKAWVALCAWAMASTASAAPPALVTGVWSILTGDTYTTLDITAQGAAGAPGASECRHISGTISIADIRGFYCPESGRMR